ncbi:MAG: cytochrome P460 family protein [Spirochaetales bacterium]|nr:cytochrome P460 family protein [Spirochaetales bacterium]
MNKIWLFGVMLLFLGCAEKKPLIPLEYNDWKRTINEVLKYPIPGHENNYRKIFINDTGTKVVREEKEGRTYDNYPDGTIIIKEIYDSSDYKDTDKPVNLTCMVKDPKNVNSRGGWVWIVKSPETGTETILTQAFCVTCHANANEPHPYGDKNLNNDFRDYVFFPYWGEE